MEEEKYHFGGWATKNDVRCSDGRTIRKDAFKVQDGTKVPLVFQHQHDSPENVIGHCWLYNRPEGVYAKGVFNDTPKGKIAKNLVEHGDLNALSIYANQLMQKGGDVLHGTIREVSLVISGANPEALIDTVSLKHSYEFGEEEEAIFLNDDYIDDVQKEEEPEMKDEKTMQHADPEESKPAKKDRTVGEVLDGMDEDEKIAMAAVFTEILNQYGIDLDEEGDEEMEQSGINKEGENTMKQNVFDKDTEKSSTIQHSEILAEALADARTNKLSLKDAVMAHAATYGIQNIEALFPEAKSVTGNIPEKIDRDQTWVNSFLAATKKSPFSRIKSTTYDITADEARAKGYLKTNMKKEEFFGVARRVTGPYTVYKKQKLDRDDITDITDFDVVALIRGEMRGKLNEEIAVAELIGDGRAVDDDDRIDPTCIRPILTDAGFYTIKKKLSIASTDYADLKTSLDWEGTTDGDTETGTAVVSPGDKIVEEIANMMVDLKGSGNPTLYTTKKRVVKLLWQRDANGRRLYETRQALADALGVKAIVEVEPMERSSLSTLFGIIVNPVDYVQGTDRGGQVTMFDDFDIDYNQYKYLIETRLSGALIRPQSALAVYFSDGEPVIDGTDPTSVFGEYTGDPIYAGANRNKTKSGQWGADSQ